MLPSIKTLDKYVKFIGGTYGFLESTFKMLALKTAKMESSDLRGMLLLDEMKLSTTLVFNRNRLKVEGFTDLGAYTPKHQSRKRGDHALVLMFQPFKGKWVQTLACFLSKGSATGIILHQLVMECIIFAERAGLKIDGIAYDGATWNRSMWDLFRVTAEKPSVAHITNSNRQLWFLSDFPHLIKNLRNFICKFQDGRYIWVSKKIYYYSLL